MKIRTGDFIYKTLREIELRLTAYYPPEWSDRDRRPAIVFFGGGGWRGQNREQFRLQSEFLAEQGIVAMCADYRTKNEHGTTPLECIADAKSAVRWIRIHSEELGVDPMKVMAGGGSAGAHIAACTGTVPKFDDPDEDLTVSSVPDGMVLFNPVLNLVNFKLRPEVAERVGEINLGPNPADASPQHHIRPGTPAAIIFHGTDDLTVPFSQSDDFTREMHARGNVCELVPAAGEGHGFFNRTPSMERNGGMFYELCIHKMLNFIRFNVMQGPEVARIPEYSDLFTYHGNIEYKIEDGYRLTLDLYEPKRRDQEQERAENRRREKPPILVYIHGGGWRNGDKGLSDGPLWSVLKQVIDDGAFVAGVNYRLADEVTKYPSPVEDCDAALNWLRENADRFGYDPSTMLLWGNSAGGHLVLHCGFRSAVAGIIALFPPVNMAGMTRFHSETGAEAVEHFLSASLEVDPDRYREASPITHLTTNAPPLMLVHGDADRIVPVGQSRELSQAAINMDLTCDYLEVHQAGHGMNELIKPEASPSFDIVTERILDFIRGIWEK